MRHLGPVRRVGVEDVIDLSLVQGAVEDWLLKAGGPDSFELQVRPYLGAQRVEQGA
jgi:hypothetical protein